MKSRPAGARCARGCVRPVKAREDRQKVMIRARLRSGVRWQDVCILNLSSHGLGIQAAQPPARGEYVEICRGRISIVARVAWTKGHRAGLRSQDALSIPALMADPADAPLPASGTAPVVTERRRVPRSTAERHERSRVLARAMEFACFGAIAVALGWAAFGAVEQALARPLATISSALG